MAKLQRLQLPRAAEDKLEVAMRPADVAVIGRCEVKAADVVGAGGSGRLQVVVVSGGGDDSRWPLATKVITSQPEEPWRAALGQRDLGGSIAAITVGTSPSSRLPRAAVVGWVAAAKYRLALAHAAGTQKAKSLHCACQTAWAATVPYAPAEARSAGEPLRLADWSAQISPIAASQPSASRGAPLSTASGAMH
jgi:hypothetical protein